MRYKAAFFDRDGTLTHGNPDAKRWRDETIASWSGKPFDLPYERMSALMQRTAARRSIRGDDRWYRDVEDEKSYWQVYYRVLLEDEGIVEDIDRRADMLFDHLWVEANPPVPFPETVEVLEYFRSQGYRMGVISDTSPSLELSLRCAGIADYFTSFTASSLVGASKPSPIIFDAALRAQGVTAAQSLYVDDYDVEADGARDQGFTSFLIDREGTQPGPWSIRTLRDMMAYARDAART